MTSYIAHGASARQESGDAQHRPRRVDADDFRGPAGRGAPRRDARPAADVDDHVAAPHPCEFDRAIGVAAAPGDHAQRREVTPDPGERRVVRVVVRRGRLESHAATLTVEPEFKSSGPMELLSIGEVAQRAGIAPSAIRYYERRGLLVADARRSGQRQYTHDTLRRLVFIGMMQDAGLSLDDIAVVLDASSKAEWKAVARARLHALDEEIDRLCAAREYLRGALNCRYDHPATDCQVMRYEIDRRLALTVASG